MIISLLMLGCGKNFLPEGIFVNEKALSDDYNLLEIRKDTIFWNSGGKTKRFVYSLNGKNVTARCLDANEDLKRVYKPTDDGFFLDEIRFYACPKEYKSIPDGEYQEFQATPRSVCYMTVKGDEIVKTDTRYDEVIDTQKFKYSIVPSEKSILLSDGKKSHKWNFVAIHDGFFLDGIRFVKMK